MDAIFGFNLFRSMDAEVSNGAKTDQVERWQYCILQWQTVLVYLIAGLKKIADQDWVMGYSARRMTLPPIFLQLST